MADGGRAKDMRTKGSAPDMAAAPRHVYGPRPLGALVPRLTRPAFRRRAPAAAQVMADWAAIVGPALAAVTTPRGLQAGTLTLACAGPVAMELQHLSGELLGRINRHLGSVTVQRLRFVQTVGPAAPAPPAPRPVPEAAITAAIAAADRATATLPAGPLRDALASLGRSVLAVPSGSTRIAYKR